MQATINKTSDIKCQDNNANYLDIYNQIIDAYLQDETVINIEIQYCCGICLEDFDERKNSILEKCEHVFHEKCLENNIRKNFPHEFECPVCKKQTFKKEITVRQNDDSELTKICYKTMFVILVKILVAAVFLMFIASTTMKFFK